MPEDYVSRADRPLWLLALMAMIQNIGCDVSVQRSDTDQVTGVNHCPRSSYQQYGWCVCDFKYTLASSVTPDELACYSASSLQEIAGCALSFTPVGIRTVVAPFVSLTLSPQGSHNCDVGSINVSHVLMWNHGASEVWDDTWSEELGERITVVSHAPLYLKLTILPQESWDGLLLSLKISCGDEWEECALLKFAGERKHPIPQSFQLKDIIKDYSQGATSKTTAAVSTAKAVSSTGNSPVFTNTNRTQSTSLASALSSTPNPGGGGIQMWMKVVLGVAGGVVLIILVLIGTVVWMKARRIKKAEVAVDHNSGFDRASAAYESIGSQVGGNCSRSNHYASVRIANPYSSVGHPTPSKASQQGPDHDCPVAASNSEYHELEPAYIVPDKAGVWGRLPRCEYNNQAYQDTVDMFLSPLSGTSERGGSTNERGQTQSMLPGKADTVNYCTVERLQCKNRAGNVVGEATNKHL